jgi:hypothetical protein
MGGMKPRFKLRHAVVGYVVALVFAFNGLLASVIDASMASGGSPFALITCLGGPAPGQQIPGQSDHAAKCSCNLSCCCASGSLARNGSEVDIQYPAVGTAFLQRAHAPVVRDLRTGHPLHLRSPPAVTASA